MLRKLIPLWLALAAAAAVSAAQADAEDQTQSEAFFEAVDVNVVNVDVYVTEKDGTPVTDLEPEDFLVLEDRRPMAISNFYAVAGGAVTRALEEKEPAESGAVEAGAALPLLPESQRLFLIVYVDNFNIRPFNRNRVFRRLRQFLREKVDAADQVMLVSYDRSLHVRQPFTADSGVIARALFDLEEMTGHAILQDSERQEILQIIDEAETVGEAEWRVRQFAESLYNDLSFTLSALQDFVRTLAGLDGRKAILYVSDGLPMTPAEDLFQALVQRFPTTGSLTRMQDFSAHRRFRELTALASSNRVSFYTIDAAGLRTTTTSAASSRGLQTPGITTLIDSSYIQNMQAPLRFMADETGGRAIFNTNDVGPGLDLMANDFDTYYSLGYMTPNTGDGRYHRVEVRVKNRSGLVVRHRGGYRDLSASARMADGTRSTMLYGFGRNPLGVNLRVEGDRPHEQGRFLVPIVVEVPLGRLELVPQGDFHVGRVKLYINAVDEDGRTADTQEVPLSIRIPNADIERARGEPYVFRAELQMRPGGHRMALGVRDEIGAVESFVAKAVTIGAG